METTEIETLLESALDRPAEPSDRTRIHPFVADGGNRRVLREWLANHDTYAGVDPAPEALADEADLCIIDEGTVNQHADAILAAKADAEPVLFPVLLLLPEGGTEGIDVDAGPVADSVSPRTVDEIVSLPIRQTELEWRVQSLLRLRDQTMTTVRRNEKLRLFEQAVAASGNATYITDLDGTIRYVNDAFERITGFSESEAVGVTPRVLKSGEMSSEFYTELWETIRSGEVWQGEIVDRRKNGETYIATQTIAPVSVEGHQIGYVAVQTDITERREGEEKLARRTKAIDEAPIGITISDPSREDNPLIYVNDAFVELTGYSRDEMLGRNCRFLQGEATDPDAVARIREAIDVQEPISIEIRNYRKDGTEFWNHLEIAPVEDETGEVANYIGFQQDVTERKVQQRELERQADLFAKAQDIADVGAWEYDFENGAAIFSKKVRELHGMAADDTPSPEASLEQYHPEDRPTVRAAFERAVAEGTPYDLVVRFYDADGNLHWVRTRGEAQTEDGERVRIRGTLQDVTDTKRRQRQLDILDRTLRHNLRNDMNVIRGQAELIKYETATDVESAAEKIIEVGERLVATAQKERAITELLAETPKREAIELAPLVRRVTDALSTDHPDAEISVDASEGVTARVGTKFETAIFELLTNAIVHSDSPAPAVEISITSDASTVHLDIADEGPPIPEMEQKILVEQEPQSSLFHGSGLGLWLVEVIVTRSNGTITVGENEPRGNVVRIELPRSDDTAAR